VRWLKSNSRVNPAVDEALDFLGRWRIDVTDPGELTIRPLTTKLNYAELHDLVCRVLGSSERTAFRIGFDLSRIETITRPWTAVFALFVECARRTLGCRLRGLNPELAAMAELVLRGVSAELLSIEPDARRTAA
jgi:hypothetical protein